MSHKVTISTYSSTVQRTAEVCYISGEGYEVEMFEDGRLVESRPLYGHTLQYAEDCAENWVEGIIK
jgi:hypothetical protein